MAIYEEKSTANAGALASIFDAVDSHFGPTPTAKPIGSKNGEADGFARGSPQISFIVVETILIDIQSNRMLSPS